jgi:hypothetical protein
VTGWFWLTTTVVGALAAAGLLAALGLDILAATISRTGTGLRGTERGRRVTGPVLALAAVLAAVVLVRLGLILHARPGP